jgi:hypothetical protein
MAQQQQQQQQQQQKQETDSQANSSSGGQEATEERSQTAASGEETSQNSLNQMQNGAGNQAAQEEMRRSQGNSAADGEKGSGDASSKGEGSAMVMASAGSTEWAFDNSFTPALIEKWKASPDAPLSEVLTQMAKETLSVDCEDQPIHHPDLLSIGKGPAAKESEGDKEKLAYLVGNQNYTGISELSTPIAETAALGAMLTSKNYDTIIDNDIQADEIKSDYNNELAQASAGDELVLGFAGHGGNDGLVGIDHTSDSPDVMPYGELSSLVSKATGSGVHLSIIMDSCHSATGTSLVREEISNSAFEDAGMENSIYASIYDVCSQNLGRLNSLAGEHSEVKREAVTAQRESSMRNEVNKYFARRNDSDTKIATARASYKPENGEWQTKWEKWYTEEDSVLIKWNTDINKRWAAINDKSLAENWDAPFKEKVNLFWKTIFPSISNASNMLGVESPSLTITNYRTLGKELDLLQTLQQASLDQAFGGGSSGGGGAGSSW